MIWKFIERPREDSLTASVFGHLLHLPADVFWTILRKACFSTGLPEHAGEPAVVEYWPKWDPTGTITNNTYVEPDIFIRFPEFDFIIEAKRRDEGGQVSDQWRRELVAYSNVYGQERRPVRMLAVGGLYTKEDELLPYRWPIARSEDSVEPAVAYESACPVHMCRWSTLLLECQRRRKSLENGHDRTSHTCAELRILRDLIHLFASHGFLQTRWFGDWGIPAHWSGESVKADGLIFQSIRQQLQRQ